MQRTLVFLLALFFTTACSRTEPVTLGFVGGLTGRASELGLQARNGMILAVEEWNDRGGLNGQDIKMDIRNDKQDVQQLTAVVNTLISEGVNAIIGPTTSTMAVVAAPLASKAQIPMFGVTVTTNQLSETDDWFFRPISSTQTSTKRFADYLIQQADFKEYAVVADLSNSSYTHSWTNDLKTTFNANGKTLMYEGEFTSGDNLSLLEISQRLALKEPDLIALATNAIDAALLIKQIRSIDPDVIIATCEWAGTPQLLQLAGGTAEGLYVPRYIDDDSDDVDLHTLKTNYENRFQQTLSYSAMLSYNATNIILQAISAQTDTLSVKDYLLDKRVFASTGGTVELNEYGDEVSNAFYFITRVVNGQFVTQKE